MAVFVVGFLLFLALAGHSDASYCICNSGLSDTALQRNIDYACGNGADCSAILQNGACYNPNTVRDHCNYAVNSYYQRRSASGASCDFQGTATLSQNPPSASSGCVYQSSPSTGGSTTPTNNTTPGGTPNIGGTTNPGSVPGSGMTPGLGLGPTAGGIGNPDGSNAVKLLLLHGGTFTIVLFSVYLLISGLI
ncbi:hypothetical protein CDL12_15939 [Handroanthus impetiginosus]|uniref:X8 domain-containing protein n=1 Tax=Handroanthus impetiginosus TaxID=429701 RepID=A0A2G9H1U9_9LAMI|nr:hypothetical protein CDL12_16285 [Handroanthus impetiginosus]PIN11471.1 hypothetical protein CDL12_15939 [Handroanthus impetiginosus]